MRVRRFLVLPLLLVTGVTIAVYVMRVDQVRVTGIRSLSASDIVRASGVHTGERILWLRLTEAERRIERIPAVASVVAERSLPGTVVIRVRERVPLARLDGARELVVDAHGVVFAARGEPVAPVLYGWRGKKKEGTRVDVRSRRVLDAIQRFPSALQQNARKIVVEPSVALTLRGGTQIRFGSINDLEAKAQVAQAILASETGHPVEYVDVRSPSVPVSKRRAPPTPSPSPEAAVQPGATPAPPAASTPPPAAPSAPATPAAGATPR